MATTPALRTANFARGLEGLTARLREPELQPSGVDELDAVLGGGFPRGSLVEVCGPTSSGRTSLSMSLLAQATERQETCAFVDVSDSLDPMSLAAAGVDVTRLLWIRCGGTEDHEASQASPPMFLRSHQNKPIVPQPLAQVPGKTSTGFAWRHPRDQMRGIEMSIPSLVRETEIGTNGTSFRKGNPLAAHSQERRRTDLVARCTGEQVESDRQAPRRGDNVRRHPRLSPQPQNAYRSAARGTVSSHTKPWKRLEQALKTTDLLLHSGGWGVVVFDLGNISWVEARRIPISSWFRFRRLVENSPTILLLLAEESCAKSCASLVLRCQRLSENWSSAATSNARSGIATLQGFEVQGEIACLRMQRQPVESARWQTRTLWTASS